MLDMRFVRAIPVQATSLRKVQNAELNKSVMANEGSRP